MVKQVSRDDSLSNELLLTKLRMWQLEINEELKKKRYKVPVHLGLGTEALVVAVSSIVRDNDNLLLTHRTHATMEWRLHPCIS